MSKECKRDFRVNQTVYLVDYWGTNIGTQALEARAEISQVDKKNKTFNAVLYGDTYKRYSFEDYGRLIFDSANKATEAANKFPKPKSIVYQKIGKRIYKKTVVGINGHYVDNIYDLILILDKGNYVSSKEIGVSIFLSEADARK